LDNKASRAAKKAISDWVAHKQYDASTVGSATLELFYGVYTNPLWGWRAFARSALFTGILTAIASFEFLPTRHLQALAATLMEPVELKWLTYMFATIFIANILSDYISLFVVERCLIVGCRKPVAAFVLGPLL
jgi:hypothetical protein